MGKGVKDPPPWGLGKPRDGETLLCPSEKNGDKPSNQSATTAPIPTAGDALTLKVVIEGVGHVKMMIRMNIMMQMMAEQSIMTAQ